MSSRSTWRTLVVALGSAALAAGLLAGCGSGGASSSPASTAPPSPRAAGAALGAAMDQLLRAPGGPPGIISVVQQGDHLTVRSAGVAMVGSGAPPSSAEHMWIASVAKAFSGATALALVKEGRLSLNDTIGRRLPELPSAWAGVTLAEALQHTSGLPDFTQSKAFGAAVTAAPFHAPPPTQLLSYVEKQPLEFRPGSRYHYSNSDNVVVALMVQAATGQPYDQVLRQLVLGPLGLANTSLPSAAALPSPYLHGYTFEPPQPPKDESVLFAPGWAFGAGGMVSTPSDLNRFIRAYARGATTNSATLAAQRHVVPGASDPPGPGTNRAGLGIFQYQTSCGTFYGHTGNVTGGYTQFVAATGDGQRSATVSINAVITPKTDQARFVQLRRIFELAVCDAMA